MKFGSAAAPPKSRRASRRASKMINIDTLHPNSGRRELGSGSRRLSVRKRKTSAERQASADRRKARKSVFVSNLDRGGSLLSAVGELKEFDSGVIEHKSKPEP